MRRLALVVEPVEGEAFASWVERIASRNMCSSGVMAELLGLPVRLGEKAVRPVAYGVSVVPGLAASLREATGVCEGVVARIHLSVFDGGVLDLSDVRTADETAVRTAGRREWADVFGSRACPRCLAESGGAWPLWWKLSGAGVCPVHAVVLLDRCPACGGPVRGGELSRRFAARPVACGRPSEGGVCGWPLSLVKGAAARDGVADLQAEWLRNTLPEAAPLLAGERVGAAGWFAAFRAVVVMLRLGLPEVLSAVDREGWVAPALLAEAPQRGSRGGRYGWGPATAAAAAAHLAVAVPILRAPGPAALAEALAPLACELAVQGRLSAGPLTRIEVPAVFALALVRHARPGSRAERIWERKAGTL